MLLLRNVLYLALVIFISHGTVQAAPPWAPPSQLSVTSGNAGQIAADANGNAIVIWIENTTDVNASYFTGGTWGAPVTISALDLNSKSFPQIAMDATGTAIAVWRDDITGFINSANFNGTSWNAQVTLFNAIAILPQVAMDGNGNGIAGWYDAGNNAYAAFFNGTSWSAPVVIGSGANDVHVAISPTGTALAVWIDFTNIIATHFNGISWSAPVIISNGLSNFSPQVGMTATGTGLALWAGGGIIQSAFFNGSSWNAPIQVSAGGGNANPDLAVQFDGNATAVWNAGGISIDSASFNGTTWSVPTTISVTTPVGDASVAMDGNGNAIATWLTATEVQSALLRATQGTVWDAPLVVDSTTNFLLTTNAALSASGRAFAAWELNIDEFTNQVFASFYDAVLPVPPPTGFTGFSCTDRFAFQRDCVHILNWDRPTDPVVAGFILRRNGVIIAELPASGPFSFIDHNRCNETDVYTLTSVNSVGTESTPVVVILN